MFWRLIGQYPLPVYQGAWNLAQSFLNVYTCHSWCPKSLRLHSGKECPPRLLGGRFADSSDIILFQCTKEPDILHRVHSWRPKSSRLYSGVKIVLQDYMEDALETHWTMFSSSVQRSKVRYLVSFKILGIFKILFWKFGILKVSFLLKSVLFWWNQWR